MTYREAIILGEEKLKEAGIEEAKSDAWLLLTAACKIDHTFYYMHMDEELLQEQAEAFEALVRKRAERIPLQYITGEQEFMGMTFRVNPHVLIPRQDTETLVEEALKRVKPGMKIMDMCTGSGCVLISILKNAHGTAGVGYDISKQALITAKENARINHVVADFEKSDLFEEVSGTYDMIVSNPPYIRSEEILTLMPEVAQYEPHLALDGKEDGLHFYRKIIAESKDYLNPDGMILFEIGHDQGRAVSKMLQYAGYRDIQVIQDLAHHDRVVYGKL